MSFHIVKNDISKMNTDAVVNAANEYLQEGAGVCGAIFQGADDYRLQQECNQIGHCKTGSAVITKGYNLKAKYIIHAVGPIWVDGNHHEEELLRGAYRHSMELAKYYACESIALPLISSGIYGYPKEEVIKIALSEIEEFLQQNDMEIYLVVYDKRSFTIGEKIFGSIKSYIDDNLIIEDRRTMNMNIAISEDVGQGHDEISDSIYQVKRITHKPGKKNIVNNVESAIHSPKVKSNQNKIAIDNTNRAKGYSERSIDTEGLSDIVNMLDETFSQTLLRLIDEKGRTDTEVYKKANIDRKLFSKIRSNPSYNPKKITAIAFAIALELNLDETNNLLNKAGYALSHSNKFDVIIEYFIKNKNYSIYDINEALFAFDQALLGA